MTQPIETDFAIIGAGWSGVIALDSVRKRGFAAKILEAAPDFGGVWRVNQYPGCRVDSCIPFYQLANLDVWRDFYFPESYPDRDTILRYFDHIDKTLDLRKDTIFNQFVTDVIYDNASSRWKLTTKQGLSVTAKFVVVAPGTTHKQHIPNFPNVGAYKGQVIHPARWPDNLDVKGKNVAVIGQGATGIQVVEQLAKRDCQLTILVRNPPSTLRLNQTALTPEDLDELRKTTFSMQSQFYKYMRGTENAPPLGANYHDLTPEERTARMEAAWNNGFEFLMTTFSNIFTDKDASNAVHAFRLEKLRPRLPDPVKQEALLPEKQPFWFGTKRPPLETDYYEMVSKDNVDVVNLRKSSIDTFTETGLVISDDATGEKTSRAFDIVVFSTGYDSVTGGLDDINIVGRSGESLKQKWDDGILTHLGMMVPDMPNAFILYGPQAPTALTLGVPFIELQVEWIEKLLDRVKADGFSAVEPTKEAAEVWKEKCAASLQATLYSDTPSWYTGSNIPGKKEQALIWFGGLQPWWEFSAESLQNWDDYITKA